MFPLNTLMEVLSYLESDESNIDSRSADSVMQISNTGYGETDSERAWALLASFAEFKRENAENYKDIGSRFTRCATRLNAHGVNLGDPVVAHRAIQAMRITEGGIPIF